MDSATFIRIRQQRTQARLRAAGAIVAAVLCGAASWFFGLDIVHAIVLACAIGAAVATWMLPPAEATPAWPEPADETFDGVRGDISRLSWGMLTPRRRVRSGVTSRVRRIAAIRLARYGLDLDDPDVSGAIRELLGPEVFEVLAPDPSPESSLESLTACLDALDRLEPARRPQAAFANVHPTREQVT